MMSWTERARRRRTDVPDDPRPPAPGFISRNRIAWLTELLRDADASPRLSSWERDFIKRIRGEFDALGSAVVLSERQERVLRQIEGKIHAAG